MTSERSIQRDIDNHCKNCSKLADQKAKIREWVEKTLKEVTTKGWEKFYLKEFEEVINETRTI